MIRKLPLTIKTEGFSLKHRQIILTIFKGKKKYLQFLLETRGL